MSNLFLQRARISNRPLVALHKDADTGPARYIPPEVFEHFSSLIFTDICLAALPAFTTDAASVNPQNRIVNQTLNSLITPPPTNEADDCESQNSSRHGELLSREFKYRIGKKQNGL